MALQQESDEELDPSKRKAEDELSSYEKALKENEKKKQDALLDLKREVEEREKAIRDKEELPEHSSHPENKENTLCPSCVPDHNPNEEVVEEAEDESNPYKRALKDNEKRKEAFIEELKAAADARKKKEAEDKARAEEEAAFKRENLEREYEETGVMP